MLVFINYYIYGCFGEGGGGSLYFQDGYTGMENLLCCEEVPHS